MQLWLQLRQSTASVTTANFGITFNNDTGTNYQRSGTQLQGSGTSIYAAAQTSITMATAAANATSNHFGTGFFTIPSYSGGVFKQMLGNFSIDGTNVVAGSLVYLLSGLWLSTAAITRITLTPASSANFIAGSRVTLYGLS